MADIASMSFEQLTWARTWHLTDVALKRVFSAVDGVTALSAGSKHTRAILNDAHAAVSWLA
jgi:hypothetical protein